MNVRRAGLFMALAYFVLIGGSAIGALTTVRVVTDVLGAGIVLLWIRELRRSSDLADLLAIAALVIFLLACVTSRLPRFSFDSALTALGFTAVYGVARRELADESARRQLVFFLSAIGAVFAVVLAIAWGGQWIQWWSLTRTLPSLDLILSDLDVYWFKYQLAILMGILAAYSLALPRLGMPRVLAGALVAVSLALIYMSGARSAWLGVAGAVLVLLLFARSNWRPSRAAVIAFSAGLVIVIGVAFIAGIGQQVSARLFAASSIDLRLDIWHYALRSFWDRPLLGSGPGTFPSLVTSNGYFTVFDSIGRGPDSAPVEILAEMGFAGVAMLLTLGTSVVVGWRTGANDWTPYGLAAVVVFALSSVTNDTVYSPQLVALAAISAALAGPVTSGQQALTPRPPSRAIGYATYVASAVIGLGLALSIIASEVHSAAVAASEAGHPQEAVDLATAAVSVDPMNGLFVRDRGMALLGAGEQRPALEEFLRANELAPADMIALRSAALTASALGDDAEAMALAERAAALRPNDIANLEVLADVAGKAGQASAREAALRDLLKRFPWAPAAPEWGDVAGQGSMVSAVLHAAADEVKRSPVDPRRILERTWLLGAVNQTNSSGLPTFDGLSAFLTCQLGTARMDAATALQSGSYSQWDTVLDAMLAREAGNESEALVIEQLGVLRFPAIGVLVGGTGEARSPYLDAGEDVRIYASIEPGIATPKAPVYPSSGEALAAWMAAPREAAARAAPDSGLAQCSR